MALNNDIASLKSLTAYVVEHLQSCYSEITFIANELQELYLPGRAVSAIVVCMCIV